MKFDPERPIYMQIVDLIKKKIARNEILPMNKLPSQRELAVLMNVNPNTVQRAYKELEDEKIVVTLRGQGTFVSDNPALVKKLKNELANKALDDFFIEMKSLGFSNAEISHLISKFLTEGIDDNAAKS
ncbi:MAG TPA: GntR family transcriptional regulator [Firmicutes bacterium]|nr:GntR family transcriptional regulator [Bacillota bacterium]